MEKEFKIGKLTLTYDSNFLKKWYEHPQVYFEYETKRYKITFKNISLGYAYYYERGPTLITYKGKNYTDKDEDYPETLRDFEKHFDLKYNCFGYVLFGSTFWYETTYGILNKKEMSTLIKILGYKEIDTPKPNCIAIFYKEEKASHIAKTHDGKLWIAKESTYPPITSKLLNNIMSITTDNSVKNIYSDVTFYVKD